jgi:hypothetical protein
MPMGGTVAVPSHPQRELKRSGANKGNDATLCLGEAKREKTIAPPRRGGSELGKHGAERRSDARMEGDAP